ncbi:hypothetical protein FNU76_03790 [Chitinimonas arctica]|uniref:Toxin CptA n=1 Tax=Chitinimonas arctica TaxID=2594795 RepID=A0A516SBM0_9NEIS|nr:protein YgfX [Chitinimonas arctica]QDQ25544.1 hypothetical protein FNU76_03790 [Chitinimonas arctica]
MKAAPQLLLQLRPSNLERLGVGALHLLALPMPRLASLPLAAQLLLGCAVLLSALWRLRSCRRELPSHAWLLADGSWALRLGDEDFAALLMPTFHCTPHLLVLTLALTDDRRIRLVLWPDSAAPAELRRLRAWLRWGARVQAHSGLLAPGG